MWTEKTDTYNGLKKLNLFLIRARILAIPLFAISAKSRIQELKNLRVTELVSAVLCISLFVLLPLREIIRLMVLSGGKADIRCILLTGPGRHSIYNGFVDRKRIVISLLLPGILFCGVLTTAMCLTWGLPVNLVGGIGFLICTKLKGRRYQRFGYSYIVYLPWNEGGLSLGLFIFMKDQHKSKKWTYNTRIHEYGHTWQCLLLGPLYYIVIAIPSMIWCNCFEGYRKKNNVSYYKVYC